MEEECIHEQLCNFFCRCPVGYPMLVPLDAAQKTAANAPARYALAFVQIPPAQKAASGTARHDA
jgi:hypothetical protein